MSLNIWRRPYIERIVLLEFMYRLVSQEQTKLMNKNIDKISQHTHPQKSHKGQLLTTGQLTWAHTHINPWSKSDTGGNKWPRHYTLHSCSVSSVCVCACAWFVCNTCVSWVFMSCEVCSGWVTYCHGCLTWFKCLCVCAPR
jgi:hypothetical protein